ncbi:DUF3891 domain-containing protein [Bacillus methanolicus]|uniref:DUF3891 family protein n=1 Tax=Bacillus methanolicus TaxID=1471 RepID=UPI0023805265|nr:DUF3891 family protein [Bacillus methanolicus]MDE3839035.1 DUF3891 domain-containing protein [Bacillus methanolicus]
MIVYERESDFVMVTQDDHARVSGEFAKAWRNEYFVALDRKEDVELAVFEHDRGWIDLDETPFWNDEKRLPFSFRDFPLTPRFVFYKKGIDEVESKNKYAALLCSLQYTTLFEMIQDDSVPAFLYSEYERQQRLINDLNLTHHSSQEMIKFHLQVLRFCDDLSLYICMHEPMVHHTASEWFAEGFSQRFSFFNHEKITFEWAEKEKIILSHFPFSSEVVVKVPLKEVKKADIANYGIAKAYKHTPKKERVVQFVPK